MNEIFYPAITQGELLVFIVIVGLLYISRIGE